MHSASFTCLEEFMLAETLLARLFFADHCRACLLSRVICLRCNILQKHMQALRERRAALNPTAGSKSASAFALMASAAQPAMKEARSMSGPLQAPELASAPSAKHAIGGGTVQVIQRQTP